MGRNHRAALDPHPADVLLHRSRRLDALTGTVNAGQSWSYNKPARPGDTITLQARALDKFIKRERLFVVHDNVFFNQHGDVICSGRGQTIRPISVARNSNMTTTFETLSVGDSIDGPKFFASRESIRLFCDASLDYNLLHLDDTT